MASIIEQVRLEAMDGFEAAEDGDHVPVALDHIYLVRITNRHAADDEQLTKLHVIGYQRGQSVTVRWERFWRHRHLPHDGSIRAVLEDTDEFKARAAAHALADLLIRKVATDGLMVLGSAVSVDD